MRLRYGFNAISVFLSGTLLLGNFAFANFQGGESSGGGDARCAEFYQFASRVSIELAKLGQAKINTIDPLIKADQLREIVMKPLQVLPVHGLDRQARSNPVTDTTSLDVDQYENLSIQEKYRLVCHELLVLANVEGDGEYSVSDDLFSLLSTTKIFLSTKCDSFLRNPDGSYTINLPLYEGHLIAWDSSIDGVCKYLGFNKHVGSAGHHLYSTHRDAPAGLAFGAVIDSDGRLEHYSQPDAGCTDGGDETVCNDSYDVINCSD